ncbi:hypothetical protein MTP99_002038 [Tenebrio molitor]|nr:hypothetical protein MTP99_002038 [Tenebrio molitor]
MPVILLDRLPVPNLRMYSSGSVLALSACIYFATQVIKDPNWSAGESDMANAIHKQDSNKSNASLPDGRTMGQYVSDVFSVMIREPICVWVSKPAGIATPQENVATRRVHCRC